MRFTKPNFVYALIVFKLFMVLIWIGYTSYTTKNFKFVQTNNYPECDAIHIGIVFIGYNKTVRFYTLLKSIYYVRIYSLHFHIIVDNQSEKTARMLFETWSVPQVKVSYYNTNETKCDWLSEEHNSGILKFAVPKLIPVDLTKKIIVIDPDVIFSANLTKVWKLFDNFEDQQFIGLPKTNLNTTTRNRLNINLILYDLRRLQVLERNKLWTKIVDLYGVRPAGTKASNQDIINEFINKTLSNALYVIPNEWSIQEGIFVSNNNDSNSYKNNNQTEIIDFSKLILEYDGNLLRKEVNGCFKNGNNTRPLRPVPDTCLRYPTSRISKWRTLLFFRKFNYAPTEYDVTLVTQLTYNKLNVLNEVARRWLGPMSLSFYVTDSELHNCIRYIDTSIILQNRTNIAYHAIMKEGKHHPINFLRNIALKQVITPYVFLNDMDLVPMQNLYFNIKTYISQMKSMNKMALIVPAFETRYPKTSIPESKEKLLQMCDRRSVLVMLSRWRRGSHGPTNFNKWRVANKPYKVKWAPKFEPYVIVEKNVTQYDERFFGYGWNKISHIMELEAQGYDFWVLPNAFAVHKCHGKGKDKIEFAVSKNYQKCLDSLKRNWFSEVNSKYGRNFTI